MQSISVAKITIIICMGIIRSWQQCSGATPYTYSGSCYANCAAAGVSYEYQKTCYASCPPSAPYDYLSVCYPNCPWIPPLLTYLQISSCVTSNLLLI